MSANDDDLNDVGWMNVWGIVMHDQMLACPLLPGECRKRRLFACVVDQVRNLTICVALEG